MINRRAVVEKTEGVICSPPPQLPSSHGAPSRARPPRSSHRASSFATWIGAGLGLRECYA
jgi:hypothetical protein